MTRLIKVSRLLVLTLFISFSFIVNALVEFDQNTTPDVIFGSGNTNGAFTTDRNNSVEVGLRAKIPFIGTTNSNGDGTYSYTLAETDHDNNLGTANRWNFDFTVNTNYDGSGTNNLDQYTYEMGLDSDPGDGTEFLVFDPITPNTLPLGQAFFDHSIGTNVTLNGAGAEATDEPSYAVLLANNNVLQQSWRNSFFPISPLDTYNPDSPGTYNVYLIVKLGGVQVARTDIQVIINDHLVTPDVIFGSGNANGDFTLARNSDVEVGLRAKIPFVGITNFDGDHTYSYTLAETDHDNNVGTANRWNFDFAVNTDYSDTTSSGAKLGEYTYEMGLDTDPSGDVDFYVFDPITPQSGIFSPDHSIGDNSTLNGAGTEAPFVDFTNIYTGLLANNNVLQNSQGYATYASQFTNGYDASIDGTYDVYLVAKLAGVEVARSEIQVIIGTGGAPANSAPLVVDDSYSVDEDTPLSIANPNGVLANDTDADMDPIFVGNPGVLAANNPAAGNLTLFADGTFNYSPPNDFNGDAVFNFDVTDGLLSSSSSVTITVNPINDAPSFTKGVDIIINEGAGIQVVNSWAIDILTGPANESSQSISFNVSNDNNGLFSTQPSLTATGDLNYTPTGDANGSATVTVSLTDDGGGSDTSIEQTFTITVSAVNDAPGFALFCDIDATDVTGGAIVTVQIPNFVYNLFTGPSNESSQTFALSVGLVSGGDPDSIIDSMSVDNAGTISIGFNINNSGVATLEVTMQDNGGTGFGGVDTTVIQFNAHNYADLELDPNYSGLALNDILYKNTFDSCR